MPEHKIALKKLPAILLFLLFSPLLFSQNETANWYFGNQCGLNFSTNPPTPFAGTPFFSPEGSASISDAAGNLLFYTDGVTVWNQLNVVMPNGSNLLGDPSSTQSAIIIKQPGSVNTYFIFTQGNTGSGLNYSVVDMSLAGGTGSVTIKNVLLYASSCEKLSAVKHCNKTDFWIVSHEFDSNVFRSYLLTSSGVNNVPVLSAVGSVYGNSGVIGYLKLSPNGKKLASAKFQEGAVELYDFNTTTGMVSHPLLLTTAISFPYGCEFSPDGTKLYACGEASSQLFQWDLCAGNDAAVVASSVALVVNSIALGALQLAQNGKIYVSSVASQNLSVINAPNAAGANCNFSSAAQPVGTGTVQLGLPNFVTSSFNAQGISFSQTCSVVNFTAPAFSGCQASANYTSLNWSFGDPASGTLNTSGFTTVTHSFNAPGSYTVKLVMYSACGADSAMQIITSQTTALSSNGNFSICSGNSATLQASGANSYTWSNSSGSASVEVSPQATTQYTVIGSYTNGCSSNSAIVTVSVLPSPTLSVSGTTSVCAGQSISLTASGASLYAWSTGAITNTLSATPLADVTYTVIGTATNSCTGIITIPITVTALPVISLNSATVCAGQSATIFANTIPLTGIHYLWQPGGQTSNSISVSPSTTSNYTLTASLNGCETTDSTFIFVTPITLPLIEFNYKTPACLNDAGLSPYTGNFTFGGVFSGEGLNIDAGTGFINLAESSTGTTVVFYSLPASNCAAAATGTALVDIEINPVLNMSPDVRISPGSSATLSVDGAMSYSWFPQADVSCNTCDHIIVSPTENTQYCVTGFEKGCPAKTCVNVQVGCETSALALPNAFSPNGDGFNDEFCLQGWDNCVVKFSAAIFNRWGEKVFESANPSFCWDGSFKGKILEADVFAYMISVSFTNNNSFTKKGNITLLR